MNLSALLQTILPEVILCLAALVLMGWGLAHERRHRVVLPQPFAAAFAASALLVAMGFAFRGPCCVWESPLVAVDALARVAKGAVLALAFLAALMPPVRRLERNVGEFYALLLFVAAGFSMAVATNHMLMLFVAIELASLSLYLMVGFPKRRASAEASLKYFLFGGVSAAFMLYGMSLIYGQCGGMTWDAVRDAIRDGGATWMMAAGLAMVIVGLGFKLAAVPFHYWAPDVYDAAPAPAMGLIAGASKWVAVVVLARMLVFGFPALVGSAELGVMVAGWQVWLAVLAVVSMLYGNLLALAQTSVRRMLAYSAVANSGYLLLGLCGGTAQTVATTLMFAIGYGLATIGALAVTCEVEQRTGDDEIASFSGLWKHAPMKAICLMVCLASLAGLPPLAGFAGKFSMFAAVLKSSAPVGIPGLAWLIAIAVVMSAVSFYYYLRVLKQAFVKDGDFADDGCQCSLHFWVMALCSGLIVLYGILPNVLLAPLWNAVQAVWR